MPGCPRASLAETERAVHQDRGKTPQAPTAESPELREKGAAI